MKVLIVCSGNAENFDFRIHQAFIYEQIEAVKKYYGVEYDTFFIKGKGILGYLKNMPMIKKKIKEFSPDLVHAHYGLSGLLGVLQNKVPVIITYHNGEILTSLINILSSLSVLFCKYRIYVAQHIRAKMFIKSKMNYDIIPCGINLAMNMPITREYAKNYFKLNKDKINILFGGAYSNNRKKYSLAKSALEILDDSEKKINLIELKGYNRIEVTYLLTACDLLLLPSKSEGSPQIIKEAMAFNCPIVATDVGDIREIIGNTEGCYISSFAPQDVAEKIMAAIEFVKTKGRTNSREKIRRFDNQIIAEKVFKVYQQANQENH